MIALLFSRVGFIFMGLIAGIAIIIGAYVMGHSNGVQKGREAALERSVDILRQRNQTDEQVRQMGDAELCAAIGGVMRDGTCG